MIKKIEKEINAISIFAKSITQNGDISPGFISELLQVVQKNLSQLQYMKELINSWKEETPLKMILGLLQPVYIRSKADKDWIRVRNISLLEKGQIFTTDEGQRDGKEYELISCYGDKISFIVTVEVVKG